MSDLRLAETFEGKQFHQVVFRSFGLINRDAAHAIAKASAVKRMEVWSSATRAALSVLVQIPGLEDLYVSDLKGHGRLRGLEKAVGLTSFRSPFALRKADMIEIAKLPNLETLIAQFCSFGLRAVQAISKMQSLRMVDFEDVIFTDEMAAALAKSTSITDVALPATHLSSAGLKSISEMPQLRYVDVWANGLSAESLAILSGHPKLEKIELGGFPVGPNQQLRACDIMPLLKTIPTLKTVYFENVTTTDEEAALLRDLYEFRLLNG